MEKARGVVTAVVQRKGNYGIALGKDNWYNGLGKCPCEKGDKVDVTYEINNNFKNIQQIYVADKKEPFQELAAEKGHEMIEILEDVTPKEAKQILNEMKQKYHVYATQPILKPNGKYDLFVYYR